MRLQCCRCTAAALRRLSRATRAASALPRRSLKDSYGHRTGLVVVTTTIHPSRIFPQSLVCQKNVSSIS